MSAFEATGNQAYPTFFRVSTDKNPAHKTIQIQSMYPLVYKFFDAVGTLLGVSQAPDGKTPLTATWQFQSNLEYPASISIDVLDGGSQIEIGQAQVVLFGADVFKVVLTYQQNIPAAHGYIDAMVDGARESVKAEWYGSLWNTHDDVWTRGSGN